MKKIAIVLMFLAGTAWAQTSPDLGGVGKFLSSVSLKARGGSAVDFNKHITGVLYIAYPQITSTDGKVEYACLGLGADMGAGVSGTKMHGSPLLLPMLNIPAIINKFLGGNSNMRFPDLGPISAGMGVKPLPVSGTNGKWILGNQIEAIVTLGFGG